MVEIINCPCNKTFAACADPYCFDDPEWQKDKRHYVKKGCTVKLARDGNWKYEKCTCPGMKPTDQDIQCVYVDKNQLSLFSDFS